MKKKHINKSKSYYFFKKYLPLPLNCQPFQPLPRPTYPKGYPRKNKEGKYSFVECEELFLP